MGAEYALPSVENLHAYLRFTGWTEQPGGSAGAQWMNGESSVGVPYVFDDYFVRSVVERLGWFEGREPSQVARSARYLLFDVTHLRAANDHRITDTIPLATAGRIVTSARAMLRAVATTARWERAVVGTYSAIGDAVVRQALMGHTERGSFVIPVLVPLPEPVQSDRHQPPLDEGETPTFHRAPAEPFARRVVRTFAQSMQAIQEIIVDPARDPTTDQIHELIYRGVSREFCTALAGILTESDIAEFSARVDWAPGVAAPATMPRQTDIGADAVDLVLAVAERMQRQPARPENREVFSGTIVQLRHESQSDPFGEIAVSTLRRGKPSEILVRLPLELYRSVWEWHSSGRAVLVEGAINRTPGKQLRVEHPIRCHPVDEMFADYPEATGIT
jgi:hypothetical protein